MNKKYRIFTTVVWFDFEGPNYWIVRECMLEFIETKYLSFKMYQN